MYEKSTITLRSKGLDAGYFYAIQLVPESAPRRIKLGWTMDTDARLRDHRVAAPTARLLRSWPCAKRDEVWAIRHVAPLSEAKLSREAFDFADHAALLSALDDFFLDRSFRPSAPMGPRLPMKIELVGGDLGTLGHIRTGQGPRLPMGEFIEFEVTVPGGYTQHEVRQWVTRHLWEPLNVYFGEMGERRKGPEGRTFRVKVEVVD